MSKQHKPINRKTLNVPQEDILKARGAEYGRFDNHALISQNMKVFMFAQGRDKYSASQAEAIEMILHKLARIANGNPNHVDSWDDIAGYAMLESKILRGVPL